jgi:hypothetical protein
VTQPARQRSLNGDSAPVNSRGRLRVPQLRGVEEGVRARSIDRKDLVGGAHHGLAIGGGAPTESGRGSSSSGGRRRTRGKGWGPEGALAADQSRKGARGTWQR